jgi:hypothetical protein
MHTETTVALDGLPKNESMDSHAWNYYRLICCWHAAAPLHLNMVWMFHKWIHMCSQLVFT